MCGCAPPKTRRAIRSVSSSVVTASRMSSSVAPSLWKTYVGRPEWDWSQTRFAAITELANGLGAVNKHEERIAIVETQISTVLRVYPDDEPSALDLKHNLARCYLLSGRLEEAARLFRLVYARNKVLMGATYPTTLIAAHQLAYTLTELGRYDQVKSLVLPLLPYGRKFRLEYAKALYRPAGASRAEVLEAVAIFEDVLCTLRRVMGPSHPDTLEALVELDRARMTLEDYRKFKS